LFGTGQSRLPANHFGSRYRDPAALGTAAERLKLPTKPGAGDALSMHEIRERAAV